MRNEPRPVAHRHNRGWRVVKRDVVVNHQECMAILLGSGQGRAGDPTLAARERRGAEEHVSRCSDCWAVLSLLHELATGEPAPGAERMGALFGCGPVQDEMYLLAGLTAEEIRRRHPHVARHLGWCHACRDRVAEVMTIERAAARGDLGPPLVAPAPPRWRGAAARGGETVPGAGGTAVVQLRRAGAPLPARLRHRVGRVSGATAGAGLPWRGPTRSAMLGALHRDDARARRRRPAPPSPSRAAARAPRRARAARPRMRLVPTLSVEWSAGGLRFRLDVPEQDLAEPLLEEVRHPLDQDTLRALEQSADALLSGAESAGFPDEARARGAVLYRTLVPSRLRPRLHAVHGPLLISTSLYGMPWELLHGDQAFR